MSSIRHSLAATLVLLVALVVSPPLHAQTATAAAIETMEQAAAERQRAALMREQADALLASEQAACYKKFLVNSCLDDAKERHTRSMIAAREIDTAARAFERETKRAEVNAKAAERQRKIAERRAKRSGGDNESRHEASDLPAGAD